MFDFLIPRRHPSTSSRPSPRRRRRSDPDIGIKPSITKASALPTRPGLPSHKSDFLDVYISFPSLEDEENNNSSIMMSWINVALAKPEETKGKSVGAFVKMAMQRATQTTNTT